MKRLLLSLSLVWLSGICEAQTLFLRSGEHGDYTRLVADLPEGTEWQIKVAENLLTVRLDGPQRNIDISSVFRRIDRTRITEIEVHFDNLGMDILLGCDCGYRAENSDGSLLVLDIGEGLSRQESVASDGFARKTARILDTGSNVGTLPLFSDQRHAALLLPFSLRDRLDIDSGSRNKADTELSQSLEAPKQNPVHNTSLTEAGLLTEIVRATAQGLLIPAVPSTAISVSSADSGILEGLSPNLQTLLATEDPSVPDSSTMRADRELGCPPRHTFDLASWGHAAGFAVGLGEWRQLLMQEFDRIDERAVLGLARHYLHYGFGQEARAAIAILPETNPETEILTHLASTVDLSHDPDSEAIPWIVECDGPAELWSVLATERIPPPQRLNAPALRLAFEELPRHLKQHLGPRLATLFTVSGDDVTAEAILTSLKRGADVASPALDLAQARFSLGQGETEFAKTALGNVLEANSELSPMALVALVDAAVAADQIIDEGQAELVAAYLFENRYSNIASELSRAHVLALSHSGQFVEASKQLSIVEENLSNSISAVTRSQVMTRLVDQADDIDFLAVTMNRNPTVLPASLDNRIASRLLNLGFAESAFDYLAEAAEGTDGRMRRILRAKAALALDEPVVAEAELLGLSGEDVAPLRAKTRLRQGDFAALMQPQADTASEQRLLDLAWLAGERPLIASREASAVALSDQDDPSTLNQTDIEATQPGVLRQAQNLIEDSSEIRSALQDLLTRFQVQDSQAP